jgi:hypothetical protein
VRTKTRETVETRVISWQRLADVDLTVGDLLERWLAAHHDWRPSTWRSARSNVKVLFTDPIAQRRVSSLRLEVVREAIARWKEAGAGISVVSGRFRVLR